MIQSFNVYILCLVTLAVLLMASSAYCQTDMQDEISYENDVKPIVKNFCTTCHAGDNPEGDFVLTDYDAVRKHTEKGELLKRINDKDDPMPQNGLMPGYMRRVFKVWAQTGFKKTGKRKSSKPGADMQSFKPPKIVPIDIVENKQGFKLLESMQGHWVGQMNLMGTNYDWMAFDYRPISPSHVHGIFEGGSIGNLFTSFFVTNFNGKRTIMARNGGILNGIYRTSYFVLDQVRQGNGWTYYRLVDAFGGEQIMYMELTFYGNQLEFNSYTSRFGLTEAKPHMAFKAKRKRPELSAAAAKLVGFPKNKVEFDFAKGLPKPDWPPEYPQTSASFMSQEKNKALVELGKLAKDPIRIDQIPFLSKLSVKIERNEKTKGKKLHVYLSQKPLTNSRGKFITQGGYVRTDLLDTLLTFPELAKGANEFTFTYLHPGKYYLTVVADMDGDGFPSPGDVTHPAKMVEVKPDSHKTVQVSDLDVQN